MKKRDKKNLTVILIAALIIIVLGTYLIIKKDVLFSPAGITDAKVPVRNVAPTITNIQAIPNVNLNPAPAATIVQVTFSAKDPNGQASIADNTALVRFTRAGETTRTSGVCSPGIPTVDSKTFTCGVSMQYYDAAGIWNVEVSVQDSGGLTASQTTTATVNLLRDISLSPATIDFPTVDPEETNITATTQTTITNNGNFEAPPGTITITTSNLVGETDPLENIPAANFRVVGSSQTDVCGLGDALIHSSAVTLSSPDLNRLPGDRTETLSYCLTSVPILSPQLYSATGANSWIISIN